jgi:hypothetical protein
MIKNRKAQDLTGHMSPTKQPSTSYRSPNKDLEQNTPAHGNVFSRNSQAPPPSKQQTPTKLNAPNLDRADASSFTNANNNLDQSGITKNLTAVHGVTAAYNENHNFFGNDQAQGGFNDLSENFSDLEFDIEAQNNQTPKVHSKNIDFEVHTFKYQFSQETTYNSPNRPAYRTPVKP